MSCQREHDGVTVPEHLTADDLAKIIANQNQQIEGLRQSIREKDEQIANLVNRLEEIAYLSFQFAIRKP